MHFCFTGKTTIEHKRETIKINEKNIKLAIIKVRRIRGAFADIKRRRDTHFYFIRKTKIKHKRGKQ